MKQERVVILGASNKTDRYSYKAMKLLQKHGHQTLLVHPALKEIEGTSVVPSLKQVEGPVDTITIYTNASVSSAAYDDIVTLKPARVIFNPGTENPALEEKLANAGIPSEEACTLVLLTTGQY
ncbi:MAG: CoA-binding protein [Verrucomicrobiaceae bacterium]|nr:CoA-binding protein [Verrucomicrobiaceae bacterium]